MVFHQQTSLAVGLPAAQKRRGDRTFPPAPQSREHEPRAPRMSTAKTSRATIFFSGAHTTPISCSSLSTARLASKTTASGCRETLRDPSWRFLERHTPIGNRMIFQPPASSQPPGSRAKIKAAPFCRVSPTHDLTGGLVRDATGTMTYESPLDI
jgi:hypothetical protein